jgi:hypothetical protein
MAEVCYGYNAVGTTYYGCKETSVESNSVEIFESIQSEIADLR